LEDGELGLGEVAHARLAARQDTKDETDHESGQQQDLPVKAKIRCGEIEAPVDHARQKVDVEKREGAEEGDEAPGDGEQGFVHPSQSDGQAAGFS